MNLKKIWSPIAWLFGKFWWLLEGSRQVVFNLIWLLILIARGWQLGPSRVLPPTCRYAPSCSEYAIQALEKHGAIKGGWLAVKRIMRCHPWGGHGFDPVP